MDPDSISPPPENRGCRLDAAGCVLPRRKALWVGVALIVLAVLAAVVFAGYRQPELLLDYVNLRYCG